MTNPLIISPSLTITTDEIDEAIEAIDAGLDIFNRAMDS
jgi:taurine---2-oxoglutarate transaminase